MIHDPAIAIADPTPLLVGIDRLVLALGGILLALALARWLALRRPDPLAGAPLRPNTLTPDLALLPVIVWMLSLYLCQGVLALLLGTGNSVVPQEVQRQLSGTAAQAIGGVVCVVLGGRFFLNGLSGYGLQVRRGAWELGFGLIVLLTVWPIMYGLHEAATWIILMFEPGFEPPSHQLLQTLDQSDIPAWVAPVLWSTAILIAPVAEELFFRGVIQTSLKHIFFVTSKPAQSLPQEAGGVPETDPNSTEVPVIPPQVAPIPASPSQWKPILITGLAFGLVHFPQPQAVPVLIFFGIALGYAYERTGSLLPPIIMHILFNLKTMVFHSIASS